MHCGKFQMTKKATSRKTSLVKDSSIYLATNILNAAIPFLLLPFLTRYLDPAEYGKVAMFQMLIVALGAFVGVNVAGATARKYFDLDAGHNHLDAFIGACLHILVASAALIAVIFYIVGEYIAGWLGIGFASLFQALLVSFCTVIIQIRLTQWQISHRPLFYGAFLLLNSFVNLGLSVLLVAGMGKGAEGRIDAQVIASITCALLALISLKKDRLLKVVGWSRAYFNEALRFGVPLIPHVAGGFLLMSADRFVIKSQLGLGSAGLYTVAFQVSMGLNLVFDSINKAYVPWLYHRLSENLEGTKRRIVKYTYLWFVAIILLGSALFFVGPLIVTAVAGDEYHASAEIAGYLFVAQALAGMYLMVTNYIFYSKRTGALSITTLSTGALNVGLMFILVKYMGLAGAGLAFIVSMTIRFLLTWWVAQQRHPMPWLSWKT
jgi:O-antigen/teichoic acid export membrane protein